MPAHRLQLHDAVSRCYCIANVEEQANTTWNHAAPRLLYAKQLCRVMKVFMKTVSDSKFVLNDLHQEIDFFDRKIAYCQSVEKFDSEDERESALRKLATRRGSLVKTAAAMVARGVECDPKHLPRSFKQAAGAENGGQ